MNACKWCKSSIEKIITVGANIPTGKVRIDCGGCKSFLRWDNCELVKKAQLGKNVEKIPDEPEIVSASDYWPFVSKRLNVEWLPNVPGWELLVVSFGATTFYRLSANVLAWLEKAGEQLEAKAVATNNHRALTEYLDCMGPLWEFAGRHLTVESVRRARKAFPQLPEHGGAKG